jgi:flagellar hook-associated protein 3 FlgL
MINRVTVASSAATQISSIQSASSRLASLQNQLSSGKRITTPSDDPAGTVSALRLRGELSRNTQYATNSSDASSWLSTQDGAYSQIVSVLQQARTAVVKGLNSGSNDANSNAAIAQQLTGLRSTLLSLANTSYDGRPVFGGTTAGSVAFDASGNYVGDSGAVTRAVAPGTTVDVSASGTTVFGDTASGSDVFSLLNNLASALTANPSTLSGGALDQIDAAIGRVSTAQSTEGAASQQVQRAQTMQTTTGTALQSQLNDIENVDMADAAVKVAAANVSYQAALQTTASIGRLSLLDFLR